MMHHPVPCRGLFIIGACVVVTVSAGCGRREDAGDVLRAMARAYREAGAYADDARVRIEQMQDGTLTERTLPFRAAFVRPDRLRVDAYDAHLAVAAGTLRAAIGAAPGQVLVSHVTSPLTLERIFADRDLTAAVTEGEAGCPTQLPLLLADDTLDLVLADATGPARITRSEPVDGHACDRIVIPRPDGELVLWIDRRARLLRRMEVPPGGDRSEGATGLKIVVEFTAAAFTAPAATAFSLQPPPGAIEVARLEPPRPPRPVSPLVGRPAPVFSVASADGESLTREALAGTIAVLEFFFDGCEPCTRTMPQVGAAVNGFTTAHASATPPVRVRHLAVSVDEADVGSAALGKRLAEYGGVGTLVRDERGGAAASLGVEEFPTLVIIAADGTIADVQAGEGNRVGTDVRATLEALAAGKDTLPLVRDRRAAALQAYRDELRRVGARLGGPVERLPEQSIAPRRQPLRFKLVRQWQADAVALPGNLLCLDEPEAGPDGPRVLALDGWRTVVALDAQGRELARHELPLPPDAAVGFLRTARDAAGRRWWLGAARGGQQVFVFDDAWKLHATYPEAGGGPHAGIAAADFTDADGDGTPEIAIGYLGTIGVHCCSLAGARQWRDRTPGTVVGVAAGQPGAATVLAATADGRLARVPAGAGPAVLTPITGFRLGTLAAGPVGMDAAWSVIGCGRDAAGGNAAIGIGPGAEPLWDISLPAGMHRDGPIEPLAWADLLGSARRQWLIAGPDGSVTVAWADGGVVDRYQHGAALVGIGGYRHGDRGYIVLATRTALESFLVDDVALD
jgi:cytochrome c biogenesis protein CcmG, thiol:disulfide interchange protein DsbE